MTFSKLASAVLILVFSNSLLTACGGGDDSPPPANTLSGIAAAGAPIIGTVTVKGSLGVSKSALIEADGSYDVDVTGLTAPYRLRAQGTVGGRTYKLHSYAVEADVGGTVNITPFTDLIIANAAAQIAEAFFDQEQLINPLDVADIDAQETALQAKLQEVFDALGVSAAIDLLNSTFSANHSGLDAALDIVRIEVNNETNIATITNLIENTTLTDDITDSTDTGVLTVIDPAALADAATDTAQIAALFTGFTNAFASGLPTEAAITNYFSADFLTRGSSKASFLTWFTTDPDMVGFIFSGIVVSNLTATTAEVTFYSGPNGALYPDPETWFVAKDTSLGWQFRGDQRIVDTYFTYHCNDGDGYTNDTPEPGACGINTQFWDEDFANNGTANVPIASGTVTIIDGTDGTTVKGVFYLGTPSGGTAGDVQIYNESNGQFQGDYRMFGTGAGEIDPTIFVVGDIIEYAVYTADLDITTPSSPAVINAPVATYTDTVYFAPNPITWSDASNKMPTATTATATGIQNYTIGNNLTIDWTLASGTRNEEILVRITDSAGNQVEIWDWNFGTTATSASFSSSELDTASLLNTDTQYELRVRIYASDEQTGQTHSRDYAVNIPGPASN